MKIESNFYLWVKFFYLCYEKWVIFLHVLPWWPARFTAIKYQIIVVFCTVAWLIVLCACAFHPASSIKKVFTSLSPSLVLFFGLFLNLPWTTQFRALRLQKHKQAIKPDQNLTTELSGQQGVSSWQTGFNSPISNVLLLQKRALFRILCWVEVWEKETCDIMTCGMNNFKID